MPGKVEDSDSDVLSDKEDSDITVRCFEVLSDKGEDDHGEDSDSAPALKGGSLVRFLACSWGSMLIGNTLCSYPAVFSYSLQRHLEISSSLTALFLSVPSLLAFLTYLLGPSVIDAFGVERVYPAVSVIIIIAIIVMLVGYHLQSVWLMLPAVCFLRPLLGIVATSQMGVLACAVDRETYAKLAGVGTSVVTLGYTLAFGLFPNIPQDKVLYVMLALSFLMALCYQHVACVARTTRDRITSEKLRATGRCFDKVSAMQRHLAMNLSSTGLLGFPWKFWLVAFCGAFKSSFYSFVDFQPYAFQRCNGLDESSANKIVSSVSIVVICLSPLAGQMFASDKRLHGPLLLTAAVLLLAARTVAAFEFSVSLAWFEMIVTGAGISILAAGSMGLVPEVLAGREELLTCGNSYVAFMGQLFATITVQVCFTIFTGKDEEVGQFDVTPGQFFMVGQGVVLLILTVAICRFQPLAPRASEDISTREGQDSDWVLCRNDSEPYEDTEAVDNTNAETGSALIRSPRRSARGLTTLRSSEACKA